MTRTPERPDRRRLGQVVAGDIQAPGLKARCTTRRALLALVVALAVGASLAPAPAVAAPTLTWSSAAFDSGRSPSAVSCSSESLCVAVDSDGYALSTPDPTAADPSWSGTPIDTGESLTAVSCAPGGPCVAVDGRGYAFVSGAGGPDWSGTSIDSPTPLTGVSCPTASLCVALDASGNVLTSTNPSSGVWSKASIDSGNRLTAVSCSSSSLCVAVDEAGYVLSSVNPAGGAWRRQQVDFGKLLAVSCFPGACVAVDSEGLVLASADPGASPATWSLTPIDLGERLTGVSCASSGLCVAVDGRGQTLASDDPAAPLDTWSESGTDGSRTLAGISCLSGGFCMAVDTAGNWFAGRVGAPKATTLAPTEVTGASATLAGAVDPNDAALGACSFEYGTGVPYTQSVPCSVLPTATGGEQDVTAQVSGLLPNSTYHYRITASSPLGASAGGDEAFTTAVSSQVALVHPNPSITGTPANRQKLTCHPGTPAGTSAQLSYVWLRDLIPIAGATASTYTVAGQDTGHHLQCQVTATDGGGSATAKSAFVTIPVGGVPASAGETAVGKMAFKGGKVSVPATCSSLASAGCEVSLRLATVETLSGGRVVAIAARSKPSAHNSTAALRRLTVTLASVRVHLARGAHRTLAVALNASGRRLLASRRRFTAYLYVSGTVIGVIESQLSQQLVTLGASSASSSTHAARRR